MITITPKNIFNTNAKCLVNPINTQGVMGAGLALDFRIKYPEMYTQYQSQCKSRQIKIGQSCLYQDAHIQILNFPTKMYWAQQSQIEWIDQGLEHFSQNYQQWNIKSIAFPMLGAGLGGLDPKEIEKLMFKKLEPLEDIEIFICQDLEPAQGTELEMLHLLFEIEPKLKNTIQRFRDLQKIKGKIEYECLFLRVYQKTKEYLARNEHTQSK